MVLANFSSGIGIDSSTRYAWLRVGAQMIILSRSRTLKSWMVRANTHSFLQARDVAVVVLACALPTEAMEMAPETTCTAHTNVLFICILLRLHCQDETETMNECLTCTHSRAG